MTAPSGRIPFASDSRRRFDPVRIREVNDGHLFEDLTSQLLPGLIHGVPGRKIAWDGVPVGAGPGSSVVEMDWATWLPRTFDYNDVASELFLDFETTVRSLEPGDDEYVAEKILNLKRIVCAPGGIAGAVRDLRAKPAFSHFPALRGPPKCVLIFISNRAEDLPEPARLRGFLKGTKGKLAGADPTIECTASGSGPRSLEISMGGEVLLSVGLVGKEKLLELSYLAEALDQAKRHELLDERFLHDLTALANCPCLLETMPRRVPVAGVAPPTHIQVDGKPAIFSKFSIDPFLFIRMCTVLRLVSDYAFLQRLPDGGHLAEMAADVETGGRFPTPVLCIPAPANVVNAGASVVCHTGGAIVSPYKWNIIDGQHRAFSYYLVKPGAANVQELDINCYELPSPNDMSAVASALFLNVNYKALKPPIDLALAHHAYASTWPGGIWVLKKQGRRRVGDSQLFSSRILAARFLLEMSADENDTVFKQFFKFRGARDPGKTSIQAISSYLSRDFDWRSPSSKESPIACRFGNLPGAKGFWTVPDPPPQSLTRVWSGLVDAFDEFLTRATEKWKSTPHDGVQELHALVSENNNVFVGIWRAFYWYSFQRVPTSSVITQPPLNLVSKLMPWLEKESSAGKLSGPNNQYRSGAGVSSLSMKLIKLLGGP